MIKQQLSACQKFVPDAEVVLAAPHRLWHWPPYPSAPRNPSRRPLPRLTPIRGTTYARSQHRGGPAIAKVPTGASRATDSSAPDNPGVLEVGVVDDHVGLSQRVRLGEVQVECGPVAISVQCRCFLEAVPVGVSCGTPFD